MPSERVLRRRGMAR